MKPTWQLDRESPLPLYVQIRQRLVAEVYSWGDPEQRFYSDEELASRFGVSKMTVRQAIRELVRNGTLIRARARGTFVSKKVFEERLSPKLDIEAQYEAVGSPQQIQLMSFDWQSPTESDRSLFGKRATGARILVLSRLRTTGNIPVAIDRRRIPEPVARAVAFDEEAARGSIINRLRTLSDPPVSADWTIAMRTASSEEAEILCVRKGSPLLVRQMLYRTADASVMLAGETLHRADIARYRISLPLGGQTS